jgi:hypothetical protein
MPRLGSTKKGAAIENPIVGATTRDDAETNPYRETVALVRESRIQAATAQLERIKKLQSSTRDRKGRIRRAKFKAAVLALRWEGFGPKDTAEVLGVTQAQVDWALTQMRVDASMDDQLNKLDNVVIPLAIDNVVRGVINGDKEYTLKVLDGRGVFRQFKSLDAQVKKTILTMKIETVMPKHIPEGAIPMPKAGAVVGAPLLPRVEADDSQTPRPTRTVDGEVL